MSPVDELGERQLREGFSPMDEVLMSEVVRFQGMMSIFFSKARGTLFYSFLWGCRGGLSQGRVDLLG